MSARQYLHGPTMPNPEWAESPPDHDSDIPEYFYECARERIDKSIRAGENGLDEIELFSEIDPVIACNIIEWLVNRKPNAAVDAAMIDTLAEAINDAIDQRVAKQAAEDFADEQSRQKEDSYEDWREARNDYWW